MECYECSVEVVPKSYPEGRCPVCDLSYILPDESWDWFDCPDCGNELTSQYCHDCNNWFGDE